MVIYKHHDSAVVNRIRTEWCEFDDRQDFGIGDERTFDWWLANHIMKMLPDHEGALTSLGGGLLYNGYLLVEDG